MEKIEEIWRKYNEYSNKLTKALGRTSNIVGEFAEYLAHKHYGGELLTASEKSADIRSSNGLLYQVKSRRLTKGNTTALNVIRSWNFDFLVVILFDTNGEILHFLEVPVKTAQKHGKKNDHQNGWVINTTQDFLNDPEIKKIDFSKLMD